MDWTEQRDRINIDRQNKGIAAALQACSDVTNEATVGKTESTRPTVVVSSCSHPNTNHSRSDGCRTKPKPPCKRVHVDGLNFIVTMAPTGSHVNQKKVASGGDGDRPYGPSLLTDDSRFPTNVLPSCHRKEMESDDNNPPASAGRCSVLKENTEVNATGNGRDSKWRLDSVELSECSVAVAASPQALQYASLRLRAIVDMFDEGKAIKPEILKRNLMFAASIMEAHQRAVNGTDADATPTDAEEMEAAEALEGEAAVPMEIKRWLVQTFSSINRSSTDKEPMRQGRLHLKSVVTAVKTGIMIDKLLRGFASDRMQMTPEVENLLKGIDRWDFDVFELERISQNQSLTYVFYELLRKYDLIRKLKIPLNMLTNYCSKLIQGYKMHNNLYHNPVHAADVAHSLHCLLVQSSFASWLTDMEIFAMIMAAIIHDLEHTGQTNEFHINTRSPLSRLYNDRSVLENHHVSRAFHLLEEPDCNILCNFDTMDYQECRTLLIDMVLATDMHQHVAQSKKLKIALQNTETLEKSRVMRMIVHASDINHPMKTWNLHFRWVERIMREFFQQGDRERELGMAISPLCDRYTTALGHSQILFIQHIINPTFEILFDAFANINDPLMCEAIRVRATTSKREHELAAVSVLKRKFADSRMFNQSLLDRSVETAAAVEKFKESCYAHSSANVERWTKRKEIEDEKTLRGDKAFSIELYDVSPADDFWPNPRIPEHHTKVTWAANKAPSGQHKLPSAHNQKTAAGVSTASPKRISATGTQHASLIGLKGPKKSISGQPVAVRGLEVKSAVMMHKTPSDDKSVARQKSPKAISPVRNPPSPKPKTKPQSIPSPNPD